MSSDTTCGPAAPSAASRPRSPLLRRGAALGALLLAGTAGDARAADVELTSSTTAQAYDVSSPWGYALERRRLLQMVGFSLYHLQGGDRPTSPAEPDYNVRLMLRLDADFGLGNQLPGSLGDAETSFGVANGSRFVPGLAPAQLDVMYAYVEGRNLADGHLSFRAGRQYVTDVLGWWSFDGALARVTTPLFVDLEAYGGFEQRGGLPLSTSRYESQGVWRGSHASFGGDGEPRSTDYPGYQFAEVAPAFGFALESNGPNWIHGRLTYRRVYNTGGVFSRPFPDPAGGYPVLSGTRTSSERLGYAVYASKSDLGAAKGGFAYDLYNQLVPTLFGGLEAYLGPRLTVGADVDYFEPVFDADSIFNWFSKSPSTTATGRAALRITPEVELAGSGGVRLWSTQGDPETYAAAQCALVPDECAGPLDITNGERRSLVPPFSPPKGTQHLVDGLGQLAGRYRDGLGRVELRGTAHAGARARRVGAEVSGERGLDGGRFVLGGRVGVFEFTDPLRVDAEGAARQATSFGYVLLSAFRPVERTRLGLEWEHETNGLVGQRFRLLASVALEWVQ